MKNFPLSFSIGVGALALALSIPDSHGFLGIFKKKEDQTPSDSEFNRMENEAAAQVRDALAKEQVGDLGGAMKDYKTVVQQFPLTNGAAIAQYKVGELKERDGDLSGAFDEYQEFVDRYRRSSRFEQAMSRQFAIAEKAKSGAKDKFLGIPRKFQDSRVIEMYEQVIQNAPFGKLAPLAQFSIAEIYQADGNKDEAVHNYQLVVDNFPTSDKKDEALFRIGAINNTAARFSNDPSAIQDAKDNLELYLSSNPEGDRAGDASAIMEVLDSRQQAKDYEIAQFYDKRRNYRAAMMYYNDLVKYDEFEHHGKILERMEIIAREHPDALAIPGSAASIASNTSAIPALASTKTRDDYVGPPAPELAKLTKKPKMRIGDDDVAPMLPIDEPDLPTDGGSTAGSSLLPPPPSGLDTTPLIIPPAPGAGTVAVPPAPDSSPSLVIPPLPELGIPEIGVGGSPITSDPSVPSVDPTPAPSAPEIVIPPISTEPPATPATPPVPVTPTPPAAPSPSVPESSDTPPAPSTPTTPEIPPLPDLPEIPLPPAPGGE